MKRLASIFIFAALSLLSLSPALAANRYQATITVTTPPTQGLTLTVNGDVRTWTTNTPTATQISIGANQSASASNLFTAITGNGFPGPLAVSQLVTNQVRLIAQPGIALTASLTGGWGSIVIVTNAANVATPVTVPISAELTADSRTNIASQIVAGINSYATNDFSFALLPAGSITNIIGSADIHSVYSLGTATLSISNSSALYALSFNNGSAITNLSAGSGAVLVTGNQTVAGIKTFTSTIEIVDLFSSGNITFSNSTARVISIQDHPTGPLLTLRGSDGDGTGSGAAGELMLRAGDNPAAFGSGGAATFRAGDSTMSQALGGALTLRAGDGDTGGEVRFRAGNSSGTYSTDVNGGDLYIEGTTGAGTGRQGFIILGHNGTSAAGIVLVGTNAASGTAQFQVAGDFNQIPFSFSLPINTINGGSNWITFAHAVVPMGKTVTINHVQSLTDGGSDPGTNQVVRIYDVSNAQTLLATNGNWSGSITITNGLRWYARFENNSATNINASASIHGNLK